MFTIGIVFSNERAIPQFQFLALNGFSFGARKFGLRARSRSQHASKFFSFPFKLQPEISIETGVKQQTLRTQIHRRFDRAQRAQAICRLVAIAHTHSHILSYICDERACIGSFRFYFSFVCALPFLFSSAHSVSDSIFFVFGREREKKCLMLSLSPVFWFPPRFRCFRSFATGVHPFTAISILLCVFFSSSIFCVYLLYEIVDDDYDADADDDYAVVRMNRKCVRLPLPPSYTIYMHCARLKGFECVHRISLDSTKSRTTKISE